MSELPAPVDRTGTPVVLIVDDDPEWRDFLCTCLGDRYLMLVGTEGRAALDIATRFKPDLVLLDVIMAPGLDGFSTLCELRKRPETREIPVIMLTGMNAVSPDGFDETILKKYLGVAPVAYLDKPVPPAVLLEAVRSVLQGTATA